MQGEADAEYERSARDYAKMLKLLHQHLQADLKNEDIPLVSGQVLAHEVALKHDEIEAAAMAVEKVQQWLEGKTIRKVIVVPGRLVNIAVS